jgi:NTE family protein
VNLNGDILTRRQRGSPPSSAITSADPSLAATEPGSPRWYPRNWISFFHSDTSDPASGPPGLFDVTTTAINIMQDRITRSRMAGDPPDWQCAPRLGQIGLMEFYRAAEAISEGRAAVERGREELTRLLGL